MEKFLELKTYLASTTQVVGNILYKLPDLWIGKILTLTLTFFGGLGGIILTYRWIQKNFFSKKLYLQKLSKLATTTSIDYFIGQLGPAVFIRSSDTKKHHTFINPFFYTVAVTDLTGQVIMFSVTTRQNSFNPIFSNNKGTNPYYKIALGKTTFAELGLDGGTVHSGLGNRHAFYAEEYYLGNPGLYQTYIFSINSAGGETLFSHKQAEGFDYQVLNESFKSNSDPRLTVFRESTPINTYSIIAPGVSLLETESGPWMGVDPDQVRLLDQ